MPKPSEMPLCVDDAEGYALQILKDRLANWRAELEQKVPTSAMQQALGLVIWAKLAYTSYFVAAEVPLGQYRIDFLITSKLNENLRFVVEVDGREFHSLPADKEKDRKRDIYLETEGYHVLRIKGPEVFNDIMTCANKIIAQLQEYDVRTMIL